MYRNKNNRNSNYRDTQIPITGIHKYKLQNFINKDYRSTEIKITGL